MNPYREGFLAGLKPDPDYDVATWSDDHVVLGRKTSAEPGRYRTDRAPFLREIMSCLSHHSPVQRVVFMKSAQIGGSQVALNWLGYIMAVVPGPVMIVQPTLDLAERFSKQRIASMIEETPALNDLVAPARARDSGNAVLSKEFKGGILIISGANSATSLRSMPVRFLMLDEADAYPKDLDDEGSPVALAEKRTVTFGPKRKVFLISTPTIKGTSVIEDEFEKSDQRRYYVPCPECNHKQYLKWPNIKWTDGDSKTARYECEQCHALIDEKHKGGMIAGGEWRATAPGDGVTAGFHINALYSPWYSWPEIVAEFLQAKADAPKLKTFVNTILGETFEEEYAAKVGADGLRGRAEFYEVGVSPARALVLTAGVDVQDNRLSISVYGWGREEEGWLVSRTEIYGDPGRPELWKQLDEHLLRPWRHELGGQLMIAATAIDSGGHFTHEVYQYARERRHSRIYAIKGQSQKNKPAIGKPTKVDINFRGQTLKNGVDLYPVGTDTIKSVIYGRFKHNEPGPGFIHFPADLPADFFEQITAEKLITRYVKGFAVREWVKPNGKRNEALDEIVYAYAMLQLLYTRYNRKTIWDQLERALKILPSTTPEVREVPATTPPPVQPELKKNAPARNLNVNRRGSGFVSSW